MTTKTSQRIDRAVAGKNGSDLRDAADLSVSPNDFIDINSIDITDVVHEAVQTGLDLAGKLDKAKKKNPLARLYRSGYNDALGECTLYFVGTVDSILAKLARLGNDNADPAA